MMMMKMKLKIKMMHDMDWKIHLFFTSIFVYNLYSNICPFFFLAFYIPPPPPSIFATLFILFILFFNIKSDFFVCDYSF